MKPASSLMVRWPTQATAPVGPAIEVLIPYRPPFTPLPGVLFGDTLKQLARLAHKLTVVRSFQTNNAEHNIVPIVGRDSHNVPIIRRAIVRFALSCPPDKSPKAAAFVAARKKEDPKWVEEVEELLRLENTPPTVPTGGGK